MMEMDDEGILSLGITADPETWIPIMVMAIKVDEEDLAQGYVKVALNPDAALNLGKGLLNGGMQLASFYSELVDKTPEERQSILLLEELMSLDVLPEDG